MPRGKQLSEFELRHIAGVRSEGIGVNAIGRRHCVVTNRLKTPDANENIVGNKYVHRD